MTAAELSPIVWIAAALALGIGLRAALDGLRGRARTSAGRGAPRLDLGDLVILADGEEARVAAIGRRFVRLRRRAGGVVELPRSRVADELVAVFPGDASTSAIVIPIAAPLAELPGLADALTRGPAPLVPPPRLALIGEGERRALRLDIDLAAEEVERRAQLRDEATRRLADALSARRSGR